MKRKKGGNGRKKLTTIPVIHRRLFRLASIACRENNDFRCEICGIKKGEQYSKTGKPQRVEAHHVFSRANKNSPLKYDLRNLCCLCTNHHKFFSKSAHKHPLWFVKIFNEKRPDDVQFILEHDEFECNLKNRDNLSYIEDCLKGNKIIDYKKLS